MTQAFTITLFFILLGIIVYTIVALAEPKAMFWDKKASRKRALATGGIAFGTILFWGLFLRSLMTPTPHREVRQETQQTEARQQETNEQITADSLDFSHCSGKGNTAVSYMEINGKKFYPMIGKSCGSVIKSNYTMAGKQAVSVLSESFEDGTSNRVLLDITFNKAALKAGKEFRAISSFQDYKNRLFDITVHYNNTIFAPHLYDEFQDIYATSKITKIEKNIAYGEFSGKLYNNRSDKNSIEVKGYFKFVL